MVSRQSSSSALPSTYSVLFTSSPWVLLLLPFLFTITASHPLLPLPLPHAKPAIPLNFTHNAPANANTPHCTIVPYYRLPHFLPSDCQDAINRFYRSVVVLYGDASFEFVTPGAHPYHTIRQMETPRRYASGSCVLAIVMLTALSPGELPGAPAARYRETDVASFQELWEGAKQVQGECVAGSDGAGTRGRDGVLGRDHEVEAGWVVGGGRGSIGIFLWSARSPIDIKFFREVPPSYGVGNWSDTA